MMGHLNSFSASGGGNLNKNFPKIKMPGGCLGGWLTLCIPELTIYFCTYLKVTTKSESSFNHIYPP